MAKDNIFFTSTAEIGKQHTPIDSESKMAIGGNVLLAPNGKPSNLTTEQYKLVRTPAFKKWFGDWENDPENASKVVDSNGEPLVCYHGSNAEFNIFDKDKIASNNPTDKAKLGFWFTDDLWEAEGFAYGFDENMRNENGRIITSFLNIREPLNVESKNVQKQLNKKYSKDRDISGMYIEGNQIQIKEILNSKNDGIVLRPIFIVFESNQIKLADGMNTTFDGNNPDIRFENGGNMENETPKVKLAVKNKIKRLAKRIVEISNLNLGDEDDVFSYKGKLSFKERRKLFEENRKLEAQLNEVTNTLSQEQCFSIDDSNFQGLNAGGDYGYQDEEMYAGGGGIDINEPFDVNGKTLAERVRVLLKQLYPTYKWSVTSSYSTMDVYLLEADFEPFTDFFKQKNPDRFRYSVDDRDFEEYMKNNAYITERAVEVFKPIREYINKFVYNRNADDPYADVDYNIYEYTYIGKWDKPYVQVAPKAGKKAKATATTTPSPTTLTPRADYPFEMGDILAPSQEKLNGLSLVLAVELSQYYYEVAEMITSTQQYFIEYNDRNESQTVTVEGIDILKNYVKATVPLFKMGDTVVKDGFPNNPLKIVHRVYYQQIGVKYSTIEKRFLRSGMYWNYALEDSTYANEDELELYNATATPTKVAIQEEIKIGTIIAFGAAYLKTQDWGLAEQMSEEYAFVESIENSGGETKLKITFVNVPKSPNISFNYSSEQIFEDYVKATVPLFEIGDMVALKTKPTEVLKITHRIFYQNGLKYSENKDRFELDGFAWQYQLADGTYFFENEIQIVAPATQTPPTTPTVSETAFLDYLKATNEKAELIPQKVEALTSLALFIKTAEEIDNIDTKKYAELLTELMEVSPKNPN